MKQKIRGIISLGLLIFWGISTFSGIVLFFAPEGQRSSKALLLFGLVKHDWSFLHTWTSFLAIGITIFHIIIDWRILVGVIQLLFKGKKE